MLSCNGCTISYFFGGGGDRGCFPAVLTIMTIYLKRGTNSYLLPYTYPSTIKLKSFARFIGSALLDDQQRSRKRSKLGLAL